MLIIIYANSLTSKLDAINQICHKPIETSSHYLRKLHSRKLCILWNVLSPHNWTSQNMECVMLKSNLLSLLWNTNSKNCQFTFKQWTLLYTIIFKKINLSLKLFSPFLHLTQWVFCCILLFFFSFQSSQLPLANHNT